MIVPAAGNADIRLPRGTREGCALLGMVEAVSADAAVNQLVAERGITPRTCRTG